MKGIFERSTPKEFDMKKFILTNSSWREMKAVKKDIKFETNKDEDHNNISSQNRTRKSRYKYYSNYKESNIIQNVINNVSPKQMNNDKPVSFLQKDQNEMKSNNSFSIPASGLYIVNLNSKEVLKNPKTYIEIRNLESRNNKSKRLEEGGSTEQASALPSLHHNLYSQELSGALY